MIDYILTILLSLIKTGWLANLSTIIIFKFIVLAQFSGISDKQFCNSANTKIVLWSVLKNNDLKIHITYLTQRIQLCNNFELFPSSYNTAVFMGLGNNKISIGNTAVREESRKNTPRV